MSVGWGQNCTAPDGTPGVELWDVCYSIENTTYLNLSSSCLTGEIQAEIGELVNLTMLNLSDNQLSGEIPSVMFELINLNLLNLSFNQLSGIIDEEICESGIDSELYLTNNQFCPPYPSCINGDIIGEQDNSECEEEYVPGDLNEDGILNILDVILTVYLVLVSEFDENGDVNCDGMLNIQDIISEVNCILGNCTGLYICPDSNENPDDCVDIDGNVYATIQIGNQLWMAENLKTTHFQNGDDILNYISYDNETSNSNIYGYLYNWYAVDDPRGICPDFFHVPSEYEWLTFEMSLGMSSYEANSSGWRGSDEGSKLAGNECLWTDGDLVDNPEFDSSGFEALPGGCHRWHDDHYDFEGMGTNTWFWTSTEYVEPDNPNYTNAYIRQVTSGTSQINRDAIYALFRFSVRCLKD